MEKLIPVDSAQPASFRCSLNVPPLELWCLYSSLYSRNCAFTTKLSYLPFTGAQSTAHSQTDSTAPSDPSIRTASDLHDGTLPLQQLTILELRALTNNTTSTVQRRLPRPRRHLQHAVRTRRASNPTLRRILPMLPHRHAAG